MDALIDHPANAGVIRSLCGTSRRGVSVVAPEAVDDPYLGRGSHPEIVERVWDQLDRGLPGGCRRILCGTPVLVNPDTGVVIAVAYGTSYCLRVPEADLPAALRAGCTISNRWSDGTVTDLAEEFGPGWVFGRWAEGEADWCRAAGDSGHPPA